MGCADKSYETKMTYTKEQRNEYQRKWRLRNIERVREYAKQHRKRHLTVVRGRYLSWLNKNQQKRLETNKRRWATIRAEMIQAYGGYCQCCGETTPEFLTLDHINGGGTVHRKQFKNDYWKMFRELSRLGWPKDKYRLLCMNCNHAMGRRNNPDKLCPHERQFRLIFT